MGKRDIIFSSILFSAIFILLVNFGEASAQFYENKAYNEGVIAGDVKECDSSGYWRANDKLVPDPEGATKVLLEKVSNPYYDLPGGDRILYQAWENGVATGCYDSYLRGYDRMIIIVARNDASESRQECYSAGYDGAKAGNPREPVKFSIQMSHNQNFYHLLSDSAMKKQYQDGWIDRCSSSYIEGYEQGEKETSDLDLAREAGELLGIEEEDVVEYFGGEEGVEQAYRENCVIATASYGSPMAKEVQMLREIRDNHLLQTQSGSAFMGGFNTIYYSFAPTIAQWENESPVFKEIVKTTITPLITSLSLLNHVSMDSEAEVLGYGISIILLNLGMYFVAPVAVGWQVKKRI